MRLALGTMVLAVVGTWAAPTPVRRGILLTEAPLGHDITRVYDTCTEGRSNCLVARQDTNEPQQSTSTHAPAGTAGSTSATISASSSTPLFSTPQSTSSSIAPGPVHFDGFVAQSNPSEGSNDSDNHLRTVGIVGGFLAGTALVAVICIILILVRNQRLRGSNASSSFRSRTRTRSSARPPIPVMSESESFIPPLITQPPPLRIHTGDAMTVMSHDLTTAGTQGHQSAGMQQFPVVGAGSASSRTTSFGQHSSGTSSGGSNVPHRAPRIPSLGLSNSRHPTPTATQAALDKGGSTEQTGQTENTEHLEHMEHTEQTGQTKNSEYLEHTEHTEVTAPSTFGSQTLAATEDNVRSDGHARTEDTRVSEDATRTAETAHGDPVEASTDVQPKSS
ncbi:unnamed protein product [Rhizoctonia solani]|uniref:Uncharacterized protein n=1 Tax=Rhizoctonia solani TaxID=456999 RepID=A0A8H3B749_9AGAM|nr:unnamed protein product [Rhizoctonia solani]